MMTTDDVGTLAAVMPSTSCLLLYNMVTACYPLRLAVNLVVAAAVLQPMNPVVLFEVTLWQYMTSYLRRSVINSHMHEDGASRLTQCSVHHGNLLRTAMGLEKAGKRACSDLYLYYLTGGYERRDDHWFTNAEWSPPNA